MAQQTAVEWLIEQMKNGNLESWHTKNTWNISFHTREPILEIAKQMEKEQIQRAFSDGQETPINHPTLPHYSREEYYNEIYKNDTIR